MTHDDIERLVGVINHRIANSTILDVEVGVVLSIVRDAYPEILWTISPSGRLSAQQTKAYGHKVVALDEAYVSSS
jgi:hypothetical protein